MELLKNTLPMIQTAVTHNNANSRYTSASTEATNNIYLHHNGVTHNIPTNSTMNYSSIRIQRYARSICFVVIAACLFVAAACKDDETPPNPPPPEFPKEIPLEEYIPSELPQY